jgi:hypothetical protein
MKYGTMFEASIVAESIYNIFKKIDLNKLLGQLKLELDKVIAYSDSIRKAKKAKQEFKSYWIEFINWNDSINDISIEVHQNDYDEKKCDGYFKYKGKIISIYGLKHKFSKHFINPKVYFTPNKKIPELKNYKESGGETWGGYFDEIYTIEKDGKLRKRGKA